LISEAMALLHVEKSESVITPKSNVTTKVENIVASVILSQKLDLDEVASTIPNVEYDPSNFPGLIYRLKKPKTATLVFSTGKMVCTGAKTEKQVKGAVQKIVKSLDKAGFRTKGRPTITIENVVASGDLGFPVDLERAAMTLENCMYEPEQFPGLVYRMRDPKTVVLIFGSGKIVIAGAKWEEQVPTVARRVMDRLLELDLTGTWEVEEDG